MFNKKSHIPGTFAFLLFFCSFSLHAQVQLKDFLFVDQAALDNQREEYAGKKNTLKKFIKNADELLELKPYTITDKEKTPPSGDKRDFVSMSPYWWPDPSKPDGLPYIRRDGERNPDYNKYKDQDYFGRVCSEAQTLAIAFYITRDRRYAAKAAEIIRVFFLDENTRMNPNLKFGQFIPGRAEGRATGLIETRYIYRALDAIAILRSSDAWSGKDDTLAEKWFEEFFEWMNTHKYGQEEYNAKNNHGTWYDVQRNSIAIFLGKYDSAKEALENARQKRIDSQIEPDGRQPLELARTKSWNYSLMNLTAMMQAAVLAEKVGVDLWTYQSLKGGSIRKALDYLLPFAAGEKNWEYKQISEMSNDDRLPRLIMAQKKYDKKYYGGWLRKIFGPNREMHQTGGVLW